MTNTNPSTSTLADLLVRVEKAEDIDLGFFGEILDAVAPDLNVLQITGRDIAVRARIINYAYAGAWESAALALVERVLPGWRYCVDSGPKPRGHVAFVETKAGSAWESTAATPALSLLAALLKALIAKVEGDRLSRNQPCGEASADAEVFAGLDAAPSAEGDLN